ncbi:MAG: hypothetical protein HYZ69_03115, partial [Candidatus Colwellbacteria bacterium]|nr:hypothetical protein [Candidatus Colwellbacteria bacterium]
MKSFEKIPAPPPPIEPEPNREASLWGYPVKIKETIGQIAERTVKLDEELLEPSVKEAKRHLLSQESSVATYTLSKISDRLGSNEGGWYKNTETGENLYVKVYNHPDQARTEYLANSIYRHLGINAPEPHLIDWDDMGESDVIFLAFASSEARGWPLSELDMRWNES